MLASRDGGASWQTLFGMIETTTVTLNTDSLDAGTYQFRILSSDGIRSARLAVTGLVVHNRAPRVSIVSPAAGAQAPLGTAWSLLADAWDLEDGTSVRSPKWVSNLQGRLGQKPQLSGVVLKPGLHTLTFSCADSKGLTTSAKVQVRVAGQPNAVPSRSWQDLQ